MHYIEDVIPLGNFHLKVTFRGGEVKVFNAKPYLTGPIFEPVNDPDYFAHVDVDEIAGSIFWPNGADFCPDFVYALPDAETSPSSAVLALDVRFSDDALQVRLSDGREVSVPLEWFPRLRDATPEQRNNWRLIARGIGIHWEDVDEDISVATLLRV